MVAVGAGSSPAIAEDNLDLQLDVSSNFASSLETPSAAVRELKSLSDEALQRGVFTFSIKADGTYNSNLVMAASNPTDAFSTGPEFGIKWSKGTSLVLALTAAYNPGRATELPDQYDTDVIKAGLSLTGKGLAEHFAGFVPMVSYSFRHVEAAFFEFQRAEYHDFTAAFVRQWAEAEHSPQVTWTVAAVRRFADPVASERALVTSELVVSRHVDDHTVVGLTLSAVQAWYFEDANDGRSDQTLAAKLDIIREFALSEGQKLAIAFGAQYTQNYSNRPFAKVNGWLIGPKLSWSM
jgi:hypothetical protein